MKGLNRKPYWYPIARSFADSVQIHSGATLELNAFSPAFCQQLAAGKSDLDCVGLCANQRVYTALSQAKGTTLNITFRTDPSHHICYPKATFDLVYSIFPNRIENLPATLEEAHRVMTNKGRLILYLLTDWSGLSSEWLGVRRLTSPTIYWRLRRDVIDQKSQELLLSKVKSSSFRGGQLQEHGPFQRIELTK